MDLIVIIAVLGDTNVRYGIGSVEIGLVWEGECHVVMQKIFEFD